MSNVIAHHASASGVPDSREYETQRVAHAIGPSTRDSIEKKENRQQVLDWEAEGSAASTIKHRPSGAFAVIRNLGRSRRLQSGARCEAPTGTEADAGRPLAANGAEGLECARIEDSEENRGWKMLARAQGDCRTGTRHRGHAAGTRSSFSGLRKPILSRRRSRQGRESHVKPLTQEGIEAFRLFVSRSAWGEFSQSSLYKSWKLACEDADVAFFNPYKLRHSFATALRAEGVDLADVGTLLGHKSPKTTARYAGVAPHKLTAAVNALQRAWSRSRALQSESENESEPTMATEEPPPMKASAAKAPESQRSVAGERGMVKRHR